MERQYVENNIELAKALNDYKGQVQTLRIQNQQIRYLLMECKGCVYATEQKIINLSLELNETEKLNGELLVKINDRDEELKKLRHMLKSRVDQRAIDTKSASTSELASNIDISVDNLSFLHSDSLRQNAENDLPDVNFHSTSLGQINENDSSESNISTADGSLYPHVVVIEHGDPPSPTVDEPITSSSDIIGQSATPKIVITDCGENTPNKVKKSNRKPNDGFLTVPRPSSGFTMKSPRASLKRKTSEIQQLSIRNRSNSLSKIVEASTNLAGLGSPSHNRSSHNPVDLGIRVNQSKDSINQRTSTVVSGRPKNGASVATPKSPFMDATNQQNQNGSTQSTPRILDNRLDKGKVKNRSKKTTSVNKSKQAKSVSIRNHGPENSSINLTNNLDNTDDCIARSRPTRQAAPKCLRDPVKILLSRYKT